MRGPRGLLLLVALVPACASGGSGSRTDVLVVGSTTTSSSSTVAPVEDTKPPTTVVADDPGPHAKPAPTTGPTPEPEPTTTVPPADPAPADNRALRATLPEVAGATLLDLRDIPVPPSDAGGAPGVRTTWTYAVEGATKCAVAAAFEDPLTEAGWVVRTLETPGPSPADGSVRHSELFLGPAYVVLAVDAPPQLFTISVEANAGRPAPGTGAVPEASPWPCSDEPVEAPPDPPGVDRAAELADNAAVFASLPVPAGASVVEHLEEGAVAYGTDGPIGYGSYWKLTAPGPVDLCAVAAVYEEALATAGWERFTTQYGGIRNSKFFAPPRSVEVEVSGDGTWTVLVMASGAVVGTRQYPGRVEDFVAGATPESRGQPVPCTSA